MVFSLESNNSESTCPIPFVYISPLLEKKFRNCLNPEDDDEDDSSSHCNDKHVVNNDQNKEKSNEYSESDIKFDVEDEKPQRHQSLVERKSKENQKDKIYRFSPNILRKTTNMTKATYIIINSILDDAFSTYRSVYGGILQSEHFLLKEDWLIVVCKTGKRINPLEPGLDFKFQIFEGCHLSVTKSVARQEKKLLSKFVQNGGNIYNIEDDPKMISHFMVNGQVLMREEIEHITQLHNQGYNTIRIVTPAWISDSLTQDLACSEGNYHVNIKDAISENIPSQNLDIYSNQFLSSCRIVLIGYSESEKNVKIPKLIRAGAICIPFYSPTYFPHGFVTHFVIDTSSLRDFTHHDQEILQSLKQIIRNQTKYKNKRDLFTPRVVKDVWLSISLDQQKRHDEDDYLVKEANEDALTRSPKRSPTKLFFNDLKFYIGRTKSKDDLRKKIERNGGIITHEKQADYAIVPPVQDIGHHTIAKLEVTEHWLRKCIKNGKILDPFDDILYRPLRTETRNNFRSDPIICTSEIHGELRMRLSTLIQCLDGKMCRHLTQSVEFLLSEKEYQNEKNIPEKYSRCIEWRIPIVDPKWILDSAEEGYLLDPHKYFHRVTLSQIRQERRKLEIEEQNEMRAKITPKPLQHRNEVPNVPLEIIQCSPEENYQITSKRRELRHENVISRKRKRTEIESDAYNYSNYRSSSTPPNPDNNVYSNHAIQNTVPIRNLSKSKYESNSKTNHDRSLFQNHQHTVHATTNRGLHSPSVPHDQLMQSTIHKNDVRQPEPEQEVNELLQLAEQVTHHERSQISNSENNRIEIYHPHSGTALNGDNSYLEFQQNLDGIQEVLSDDDSEQSSQSIDIEAFQKLIEEIPEIQNNIRSHLSQNENVVMNNQITRADLRRSYIIDTVSEVGTIPTLNLSSSGFERNYAPHEQASTHTQSNTTTTKNQTIIHSQHIGWRGGTQSATQYNNHNQNTYCIGISNEANRQELESMVVELGGTVSEDPELFTHLVVGTLKKTPKVFCAIASRIDILHPIWIRESYRCSSWLPTQDYLWTHSRFDNAIRKDSTDVSRSVQNAILLHRALRRKLFDGLRFGVIVDDHSKRESLLQILHCGGAIESYENPKFIFVIGHLIGKAKQKDRDMIINIYQRNRNVIICDIYQLSQKIMNPEFEIQPCVIPWLHDEDDSSLDDEGNHHAAETNSDLSGNNQDVPIVKRTKRKRIAK